MNYVLFLIDASSLILVRSGPGMSAAAPMIEDPTDQLLTALPFASPCVGIRCHNTIRRTFVTGEQESVQVMLHLMTRNGNTLLEMVANKSIGSDIVILTGREVDYNLAGLLQEAKSGRTVCSDSEISDLSSLTSPSSVAHRGGRGLAQLKKCHSASYSTQGSTRRNAGTPGPPAIEVDADHKSLSRESRALLEACAEAFAPSPPGLRGPFFYDSVAAAAAARSAMVSANSSRCAHDASSARSSMHQVCAASCLDSCLLNSPSIGDAEKLAMLQHAAACDCAADDVGNSLCELEYCGSIKVLS